MKIIFQKSFEKKYVKLSDKIKSKVKERNVMFAENPFHPLLNNHPLHGKYKGYRSINITGDLRAVYKEVGTETYLFVEFGTHAELYGK